MKRLYLCPILRLTIYLASLQNRLTLLVVEQLTSNFNLIPPCLYITMCLTLRTIRAKRPHHSCGASTRYVRSINTPTKNSHKNMRVYQNRHILSFKFLKLNLSTKRSTVFIKIVDYFSKRVDPSVKKRLTFSSKKVDLFVKKG